MKRLKQFDPLIIESFEEDKYHLPRHNHTYYEIVYIYYGEGIHFLDAIQMRYKKGDIFFLAPEDNHYFKIEKNTRFVFIKFTDAYFTQGNYLSDNSGDRIEPARMMRHHILKESILSFSPTARFLLKNIIDNILRYTAKLNEATSAVILLQILSLFALTKEAVRSKEGYFALDNEDNEGILMYVHQHIYQPEKLQIKPMAEKFHIAPNYFSAFFKRSFGLSFRDYINNYRTKLIEQRVISGTYTIKAIAAEFGFTDESHLSRFFRKRFHLSPREYKMRYRQKLLNEMH